MWWTSSDMIKLNIFPQTKIWVSKKFRKNAMTFYHISIRLIIHTLSFDHLIWKFYAFSRNKLYTAKNYRIKVTYHPHFQPQFFRKIKNLPQAQLVGLRLFSCLDIIGASFWVKLENSRFIELPYFYAYNMARWVSREQSQLVEMR